MPPETNDGEPAETSTPSVSAQEGGTTTSDTHSSTTPPTSNPPPPPDPFPGPQDTELDSLIDSTLASRRHQIHRPSITNLFKRDRRGSRNFAGGSPDNGDVSESKRQSRRGKGKGKEVADGRDEIDAEAEDERMRKENISKDAREEIDRLGGEIGIFVVKATPASASHPSSKDRASGIPSSGLDPSSTNSNDHNSSFPSPSSDPKAINLYADTLNERKEAIKEVKRQRKEMVKGGMEDTRCDVLWENQRG